MSTQHYLIGYDIHDNTQRNRALRLLRKQSLGYQNSVFEVEATALQHALLLDQLTALLTRNEDTLFSIHLNSMSRCDQLGSGFTTPTGPLLIIN